LSGLFVVVDGIDGAGKSELVVRLAESFMSAGVKVMTTFEPTKGKYGSELRNSFVGPRLPLEEEIDLFVKDRRDHIETIVRPALARNELVICDRYWHSTCAYQGARGADVEGLIRRHEFALEPDVMFLLDLEPNTAVERIKKARGTFSSFERLKDLMIVREIFLDLAERFPYVQIVDADIDQNVLLHGLLTILDPLVQNLMSGQSRF